MIKTIKNSLKYADIDSAPYTAHRLKAVLADAEPLSTFSLTLFKRVVKEISLEKDGTVSIKLLNDLTTEEELQLSKRFASGDSSIFTQYKCM